MAQSAPTLGSVFLCLFFPPDGLCQNTLPLQNVQMIRTLNSNEITNYGGSIVCRVLHDRGGGKTGKVAQGDDDER